MVLSPCYFLYRTINSKHIVITTKEYTLKDKNLTLYMLLLDIGRPHWSAIWKNLIHLY